MTFSNIVIAITVNEINAAADGKSATISGVFQDKKKGLDVPVTVQLFGKAVELAPRLLNKLALVDGELRNVNKAIEIHSTSISPAAIPGYNCVQMMIRLGKDPEVNETDSYTKANMFGFVNHTKELASAFGVSAFGKTAEIVGKYVNQGDLLILLGRINAYQGKEAVMWGLNAQKVTLLPKALKGAGGLGQAKEVLAADEASTKSQAKEDWNDLGF